MLTAEPFCAVDATCLVTLVTEPERVVTWTLQGAGTLTPLQTWTGSTGVASAIYTPDSNVGETVTVGVEYGV